DEVHSRVIETHHRSLAGLQRGVYLSLPAVDHAQRLAVLVDADHVANAVHGFVVPVLDASADLGDPPLGSEVIGCDPQAAASGFQVVAGRFAHVGANRLDLWIWLRRAVAQLGR